MASTYGNDLRLEEIGDGEQSGTWGATTNTNLELIAEALSFGTEAITTNADSHTTAIADGATDPGRSLYLKYTGTLDSTCTITITPEAVSKVWYIENGTSGSHSIIISCGSGANVTIPTGQTKVVYSDGSGAMGEIGTLGVTNLAVTTNATIGGNIIVSGTVDGVDLQTLNNAVTANTAKTGITSSQASAITANTAKTGITSSQASAITANTAKTTNATHSGEVTGSGALTIASNVVDEANLKVSNGPTNGYFLSAQSGNTGGLTWAAIETGGEEVVWPSNWASPTNTYTSSGTWSKGSLADDDYVWIYIVGGGGGGDSGSSNKSGGQGGSAYLLYGKAGTFNGGTYVVGAGRGANASTNRVVSSFTLSSANGGAVFTTGGSNSNTTRGWARIANASVVDTGSSPASNLIATPNDSSDIVLPSSKPTVPSPTSGGTTQWVVASGMSSGGSYPENCVFGGGGGGGVYSNWDKTGGGSLHAGNGATGSGGTAAQVPGGGGGGGPSGTAGANGNVRVYHV